MTHHKLDNITTKAAADVIRRIGANGGTSFQSFVSFILSTLASSPHNQLSLLLAAASLLLVRGKTPEEIRGPAGSSPVLMNGKPLVWE